MAIDKQYNIQDELHSVRSGTKKYYIIMTGKNVRRPQWIGTDGIRRSGPYHNPIRFDSMADAWEKVKLLTKKDLQEDYDVYIVHDRRAMKIITFSDGDPMATLMLPRVWVKPEPIKEPYIDDVLELARQYLPPMWALPDITKTDNNAD